MARDPRVLMLVPDPRDAEMMEIHLRKAKTVFSIQRVGLKDQFLRAIQEKLPDLIIVDLSTPRFDAIDALRTSQEVTPGVPWIVVAEISGEEVAVQCMKAGAADFLHRRNISRIAAVAEEVLTHRPGGTRGRADGPTALQPVRSADVDMKPVRALTDATADFVAVLDARGTYAYVNASYARLLGEGGSLHGTAFLADVHPDDRSKVSESLQQVLHGQQLAPFEYRLIDQDASMRVVEARADRIPDADDPASSALVIIARDAGPRKSREEAFQAFVKDIAPLAGKEFFMSLARTISRVVGAPYVFVTETLSQKCERVRTLACWAAGKWIPPFDYDVHSTPCQDVFRAGTLLYYPSNIRSRFPVDGPWAHWSPQSYCSLPLKKRDGSIVGHLVVMDTRPLRDPGLAREFLEGVAPRTAAEVVRTQENESLQNTEDRLRDTLNALTAGIVVTDSNDIITYVNEAAGLLFGFPSLTLIGKSAHLVLPVRELRAEADPSAGLSPGFEGRRVTLQKAGRTDITVDVSLLSYTSHGKERENIIYLLRHLLEPGGTDGAN